MSLIRFHPFFDDAFFDEPATVWPLFVPSRKGSSNKQHQSRALAKPSGASNSGAMTLSSLGHVDVIERDGDYQVHVDLPGVDMKDVELSIANGMLHVKAERRQKHEEKTEFSHTVERSYGMVQRSIALPENADANSGNATLDSGVLTVQFTKKPAMEPSRKLEIRMGPASQPGTSG